MGGETKEPASCIHVNYQHLNTVVVGGLHVTCIHMIECDLRFSTVY